MNWAPRAGLLALILLATRPAHAYQAPKYTPPEMTQPTDDHKSFYRGKMDHYANQESKEEPIPWAGIGLAVLVLAGFAILARKQFRRDVEELYGEGAPVHHTEADE